MNGLTGEAEIVGTTTTTTTTTTTGVGSVTTTDDATFDYTVDDAKWVTGIDYSETGRPFKIARTGPLGSGGADKLVIDQAGDVFIPNNVSIAKSLATSQSVSVDGGIDRITPGVFAVGTTTASSVEIGKINSTQTSNGSFNVKQNLIVDGETTAGVIKTVNIDTTGFDWLSIGALNAGNVIIGRAGRTLWIEGDRILIQGDVVTNSGVVKCGGLGPLILGNNSDVEIGTNGKTITCMGGLIMTSTTKAFALQLLTTTQRNELAATKGSLIYNTTTDQVEVFGTTWRTLSIVSVHVVLAFGAYSAETPTFAGSGATTVNGLKASVEGLECNNYTLATGLTNSTTPTSYDATSVTGAWMDWSFPPKDKLNKIIMYTRVNLAPASDRDWSRCHLLLSTDAGTTWTIAGRTELVVDVDMVWELSASVYRRFVVTFQDTASGVNYNRLRLVLTKCVPGGSGNSSIVEMELFGG